MVIVPIAVFDKRQGAFVSAELIQSVTVTYTLKGFCLFIGIAQSKFYET